MSFTVIVLLALAALVVVAVWWWVRARADEPSRGEPEGERFETTMGALRDLREALGPSERAAQDAARAGRKPGSGAPPRDRP